MSRRVAAAALAVLSTGPAAAQEIVPPAHGPAVPGARRAAPPGFAASRAGRQAEFEARLRDAVRADSLAGWARALAAAPHAAGTPAQAATRDSVVRWLAEAGLASGHDTLRLYLPWPLRIEVTRTAPDSLPLPLVEPPLPEYPASARGAVPTFHAYSGSGAVDAEVVYANFGLPADYALLDSLGISVRDRVVVARYGRSFRGIKAREAERRGAAALLLYNDPAGDGAARGEVVPEGRWRPPRGVQRGSLLNTDGDPSTPAGPSLPGAPRVPEAEMEGIASIPVVPLGYGPAAELLRGLAGPEAPRPWQGGLRMDYRLGPGPVRARVEAEMESGDAAYREAWNTVARLPGSEWPDEWVVVGAHRDAWGPGAMDNVSGTATVIAAARAFARAAADGWRPRRTLVFATWDAEEWGVIGSIEWVEAHAARLGARAVAYLNLDAVVSGPAFGAAASPGLKALVREAAAAVEDPSGEGSVADAWLARLRTEAERAGRDAPDEGTVGDLGGGSDHKGFWQHLGIPAAGFGFHGGGGVYHSLYDTPAWMERFGDPGYRYHAAAARIAVTVLARLADADLLPFDHVEAHEVIAAAVHDAEEELGDLLRTAATGQHGEGAAGAAHPYSIAAVRGALDGFGRLARAVDGYGAAARRWAEVREEALGGSRAPAAATLEAANAALRRADRVFADSEGLEDDPWTRQVLFASDPDNGYATLPLPAIRLAIRRDDPAGAGRRALELSGALEAATAALSAAAGLVRPRSPDG